MNLNSTTKLSNLNLLRFRAFHNFFGQVFNLVSSTARPDLENQVSLIFLSMHLLNSGLVALIYDFGGKSASWGQIDWKLVSWNLLLLSLLAKICGLKSKVLYCALRSIRICQTGAILSKYFRTVVLKSILHKISVRVITGTPSFLLNSSSIFSPLLLAGVASIRKRSYSVSYQIHTH